MATRRWKFLETNDTVPVPDVPVEEKPIVYLSGAVNDPIVQANIDRLTERHLRGMLTYGTTMADNPLDTVAWIDHTIEELLDAANYLERLKQSLNDNS